MRSNDLLFILTLFIFLASSCEKDSDQVECLPAKSECEASLIQIGEDQEGDFPPVAIWRWEVDGETYYYAWSDCCDAFNPLYTDSCDLLCHPDGGIADQGDGNCPEFEGEVVSTLVWERE